MYNDIFNSSVVESGSLKNRTFRIAYEDNNQYEDRVIEFLLSELYGVQTTENYFYYHNNYHHYLASINNSSNTNKSAVNSSGALERPGQPTYKLIGLLSDVSSHASHFRASLRDLPLLHRTFKSTSSPHRLFLLSVLSKLGLLPHGTVVTSLLAPLTSPWEAKRYRLVAQLGYVHLYHYNTSIFFEFIFDLSFFTSLFFVFLMYFFCCI